MTSSERTANEISKNLHNNHEPCMHICLFQAQDSTWIILFLDYEGGNPEWNDGRSNSNTIGVAFSKLILSVKIMIRKNYHSYIDSDNTKYLNYNPSA